MTTYHQSGINIRDFSKTPIWQRTRLQDMACVLYGLFIVVMVAVSYILGAMGWLPHDPQSIRIDLMNAPPGAEGFLLGTDFMGRDILSRMILGIQAYFLPGLLAIGIALGLGSILGLMSGYRGGRTDTLITIFANLVESFPRMVLILLMIAAFKPDIYIIMAIAGLTQAPAIASLVKSRVLLMKQQNFIEAAIALGLKPFTIIWKHIFWHNCRTLLVIQATLGMAEAILLETSLSYLGFGVQEPTPSWGNMVQAGANYFLQGVFWPSTLPALAILFTILGFHLLGDGLNNMLERQQRPLG